MTPDDNRAAFTAAVDALVAATARFDVDRSGEAWRAWVEAMELVKRLHEPVETRARARALKVVR